MKKTKVLILYSELAEYFVACLRALAQNYPCEIMIVRWEVNQEAPFEFRFPPNAVVYTKSAHDFASLQAKSLAFAPDVILTSGWMDKDYLKLIRLFKGIPIIAGVDNPWRGDAKQKWGSPIFGFYIRRIFTHIWCPGIRQYELARRLGFEPHQILLGYYAADVNIFLHPHPEADKKLPKTILYIGRFIDVKGVRELYQAFDELSQERPSEWKLRMVGRGDLRDTLPPTTHIEIQDFIPPSEVAALMQQVGCFVTAGWKDHWGVAIHEAAAAACPLIVSDEMGATPTFVKDGYNGFIFQAQNKESIKKALIQMMELSVEERMKMGKRSQELSLQITPEMWAATLMSVLKS